MNIIIIKRLAIVYNVFSDTFLSGIGVQGFNLLSSLLEFLVFTFTLLNFNFFYFSLIIFFFLNKLKKGTSLITLILTMPFAYLGFFYLF
jgi:hypothetical protein